MGKLDRVNANLEKLTAVIAKGEARLEKIRQQKSELEQTKKELLEQEELIIHKQSRKERTRKLIQIGALVAKKYNVDLTQNIDLAAIEKMINKRFSKRDG